MEYPPTSLRLKYGKNTTQRQTIQQHKHKSKNSKTFQFFSYAYVADVAVRTRQGKNIKVRSAIIYA